MSDSTIGECFASPTNNEIAERAYQYYLDRSQAGQSGNEVEDWLRAESDLKREKGPALALFSVRPRRARKSKKVNGPKA